MKGSERNTRDITRKACRQQFCLFPSFTQTFSVVELMSLFDAFANGYFNVWISSYLKKNFFFHKTEALTLHNNTYLDWQTDVLKRAFLGSFLLVRIDAITQLFGTPVVPVMTYGAEVCFPYTEKNYRRSDYPQIFLRLF